MADEVITSQPLSAMSTSSSSTLGDDSRATKGGAAGHDRHKKDKNSKKNRRPNNGNIFTGILGFFTGVDMTKNNKKNPGCDDGSSSHQQQQRPRSDTDRADAMSTPLTAHDSGGEESELRDHDPAPLQQSGWGIHPPVAGGQPRRRTSQPVAIKQASGTRAKRGTQEPTRAPTGARGGGNTPQREEEVDAGGDADEDKIKAWQRRRIDAKRESFTVREPST